jgi:hypothetical protein
MERNYALHKLPAGADPVGRSAADTMISDTVNPIPDSPNRVRQLSGGG